MGGGEGTSYGLLVYIIVRTPCFSLFTPDSLPSFFGLVHQCLLLSVVAQ